MHSGHLTSLTYIPTLVLYVLCGLPQGQECRKCLNLVEKGSRQGGDRCHNAEGSYTCWILPESDRKATLIATLTKTAVLSEAFTPALFTCPSGRKEGSDLARAEGPGHHNQDRTPGILCSSLGPFSTRHRTQLLLVGGTTGFNRQKSLILFFFKTFYFVLEYS